MEESLEEKYQNYLDFFTDETLKKNPQLIDLTHYMGVCNNCGNKFTIDTIRILLIGRPENKDKFIGMTTDPNSECPYCGQSPILYELYFQAHDLANYLEKFKERKKKYEESAKRNNK